MWSRPSWRASFTSIKTTDGAGYLYIEAGGFSGKNPVGWKSPLVVMKKKP
jgi:hypothetical protein